MSSNQMFTKYSQFNVDAITYGKTVIDKRGNKRIPILYQGKKLSLSTPLMFTWGANERVSEDTGRISYDIEPILQSDKSNSISVFREKMQTLQNKILDDSVTHSKEWFGKAKMSRDVAEDKLWPMLKYPKMKDAKGNYTSEPDYSKDPKMKLKIPYWDGKFTYISVYELSTEKGVDAKPLWLNPDKCENSKPRIEPPQDDGVTPLDFMPSRTYIKAGFQCNGIYFAAGKFSIGWTMVDVQVRPPVTHSVVGKSAMEYDEDDDEILQQVSKRDKADLDQMEAEEKVDTGPSFSSDGEDEQDTVAADDDDEEEEEVVESPPKPKKKKKVVRRKKKVASTA